MALHEPSVYAALTDYASRKSRRYVLACQDPTRFGATYPKLRADDYRATWDGLRTMLSVLEEAVERTKPSASHDLTARR